MIVALIIATAAADGASLEAHSATDNYVSNLIRLLDTIVSVQYHTMMESQAPKPYAYGYLVKDEPSNNYFGHRERSDGRAVIGQYFVLLPDGRLQTVTYTADGDNGYVADVRYD